MCALAAFFQAASAAAPIALVDDLGRGVHLAAPAKRIVSLAPFLTELAYSAGAGAQMVGASAYSDYPAQARALPQVASAAGLSIEALLALRPDLVLAWRDSIRAEDIDRIQRLGVATFVAQARRLDDVPRLLEAIGRLAGRDVGAAARDFRASLERLRAAHANLPRLRVFVEVWHRPLTTIAGPHWINESLELCGAQNVFMDLDSVAPVVSWEELYRRDPWAVVGAGSAAGADGFHANWKPRAALGAVAAGRLIYLDADTIQRPTVRLAAGVAQLCAGLDALRK